MRLTFQLRFHTHPGQSLFLLGEHEVLGDNNEAAALPLQYANSETWQVTVLIPRPALPETAISYHYILRNPDGSLVSDWGEDRKLNLFHLKADQVLVIDSWNDAGFVENTFYTEPFREVLLKSNFTETSTSTPDRVTHVFNVKAPLLAKGETICLLGDSLALGNWNTGAAVLLSQRGNFFSVELNLSQQRLPLAYKYGVFDLQRQSFVRYEDGSNRVLNDTIAAGKLTLVNDGFAVLPAPKWKGAGVAVPVFSLRSEQSFGVGEFLDLKLLADWCRQTGLKLIQILPVNDTRASHTWTDSYPYAAVSAFALHPIYLNLDRLATGPLKKLLSEMQPERQRLNALPELDYEAVIGAKLRFLQQAFARQKAATFKSKEYRRFFEANEHWLVPYAIFSHLRDTYGTADFNQWPEHRTYVAEEARRMASPDSSVFDAIAFHYFVQFHLHLQLREGTEYAHDQGVILKGDIAIGVARHGADAWQDPELFHVEMQAGAPPDPFSAKGQNWGFPTYNWPRMKATGYAWWKQRFEQMGRYFDAFRIDHILGFFRIWSVPLDAVEGILGFFVPAIPVNVSEFSSRGIQFERDRLIKPFITDAVLTKIFDSDAETVKRQFLQRGQFGHELKPEFTSQRQVEAYFAALESSPENELLKHGLLDLLSNVLLFEVAGSQGREYHFRFGIEDTSSFQQLDPHTQAVLRDLYVDYFFRRQEGFWRQQGLDKLPALKRTTNMLVCGEDLGMVPACVPEVMQRLGLLSLEVQRMPKRLGQEFSRPKDAPYLSVVTPSTHDMSTIRGWWEEDGGVRQKFYNHELGLPGTAPVQCEPWVNERILTEHLASPAMWSIFLLQDLLGIDEQLRRKNPDEERINVPANPRNYWRYRMHLTLEQLMKAVSFNEKLKSLVSENGRRI